MSPPRRQLRARPRGGARLPPARARGRGQRSPGRAQRLRAKPAFGCTWAAVETRHGCRARLPCLSADVFGACGGRQGDDVCQGASGDHLLPELFEAREAELLVSLTRGCTAPCRSTLAAARQRGRHTTLPGGVPGASGRPQHSYEGRVRVNESRLGEQGCRPWPDRHASDSSAIAGAGVGVVRRADRCGNRRRCSLPVVAEWAVRAYRGRAKWAEPRRSSSSRRRLGDRRLPWPRGALSARLCP